MLENEQQVSKELEQMGVSVRIDHAAHAHPHYVLRHGETMASGGTLYEVLVRFVGLLLKRTSTS